MRVVVCAIVLVSASPGRADPGEPASFVGGGVSLGASHLIDAALVMEGAVKLPGHTVWIRGSGSYGNSFDFEGGGLFLRGSVGAESMSCSSPSFCWIGGTDFGYQRETWKDQDDDLAVEKHYGFLAGLRVGLDAGGDNLRFRLAFDLAACERRSNVDATSWGLGGGLTMTLAYRM